MMLTRPRRAVETWTGWPCLFHWRLQSSIVPQNIKGECFDCSEFARRSSQHHDAYCVPLSWERRVITNATYLWTTLWSRESWQSIQHTMLDDVLCLGLFLSSLTMKVKTIFTVCRLPVSGRWQCLFLSPKAEIYQRCSSLLHICLPSWFVSQSSWNFVWGFYVCARQAPKKHAMVTDAFLEHLTSVWWKGNGHKSC